MHKVVNSKSLCQNKACLAQGFFISDKPNCISSLQTRICRPIDDEQIPGFQSYISIWNDNLVVALDHNDKFVAFFGNLGQKFIGVFALGIEMNFNKSDSFHKIGSSSAKNGE